MDDSIVAFPMPSLTALMHCSLKRRKWNWEATCPELSISVSAEQRDDARDALRAAVEEFLATASTTEIEARLAKGTTYMVEPLVLGAIARADDEADEDNWLQRRAGGVRALAGAAKGKSGDLAASVVGVAAGSGRFVAGGASSAYERIGVTASHAYDKVGGVASSAYARTHDLAARAAPLLIGLTEGAGNVTDLIAKNPTLGQLAKRFHLEQWLDVSNRVDIEKAAQAVAELKASYRAESNRQIARRLIAQKALYAGGVGLSTSLLPGAAVPLLALDMATTALLQAELVFQIAAAYGLDLKDPARKGEMLAVFGCVLGGGKAVKAAQVGLEFLRNAPVAGAVIGATSNAAMIYALGNVACNFYEKRLDLAATAEAMEAVKQENARFLESSAHQRAIADQILLRLLLAAHPDASKTQSLAVARAMNFSEDSVEAMGNSFDAPQSLDELLPQLNGEFAGYVAAKAHEIVQHDGAIADEEAILLKAIHTHFAGRIA